MINGARVGKGKKGGGGYKKGAGVFKNLRKWATQAVLVFLQSNKKQTQFCNHYNKVHRTTEAQLKTL